MISETIKNGSRAGITTFNHMLSPVRADSNDCFGDKIISISMTRVEKEIINLLAFLKFQDKLHSPLCKTVFHILYLRRGHIMKDRPKIGLALGGGASRGLAHIGVLQVLEEHEIFPDLIAGSSIGALIGAIYSAGVSPKMIGGIASKLDMRMYYDVGVPKLGFIKGDKLEELIKILTRGKTFNELNIPLRVTAVDLKNNNLVIIDEGMVYKAVRASISIPGIFTPVFDGDRVLVDGGLLERVPASIVRNMGADIVIASDVGFKGQHGDATNILGIILQSIEVMESAIVNKKTCDDDIFIYPNLSQINPLLFDKVDECIEGGRKAALKVIDEIVERVKSYISK